MLEGGWGPSILQLVYDSIRRRGASRGHAASIMHSASVITLAVEGFKKALMHADGKPNPDGEKAMRRMLAAMRKGYDSLGILGYDKADELKEQTRTFTGLRDLMEVFDKDLVADTDLPREILLGETPGGLNSGKNEGAMRAWYDHVGAQQKKMLVRPVNRVTEIQLAVRRNAGRRGGGASAVPTEWTVEFRSLWQQTEEEEATAREKRAKAGLADATSGAVTEVQLASDTDLAKHYDMQPKTPEGDGGEAADPMPAEKLISAAEAGRRLSVGPSAILSMRKRGEIRGWRVGGRWRFAWSEIAALAGRVPPANAALGDGDGGVVGPPAKQPKTVTDALSLSKSESFGPLRGRSVAMREVFSQLERVAPSEMSVLIGGETGTGKELAAHGLHENSARASGPCVRPVRGGGLWGFATRSGGGGAFGGRGHAGAVRARGRLHVVPRRVRRAPGRCPAHAAARALSAGGDQGRYGDAGSHGRPGRGGHPPRPGRYGEVGRIPRRPVLPSRCGAGRASSPAGPGARHPGARGGFSRRARGKGSLDVVQPSGSAGDSDEPVAGQRPGASKRHPARPPYGERPRCGA